MTHLANSVMQHLRNKVWCDEAPSSTRCRVSDSDWDGNCPGWVGGRHRLQHTWLTAGGKNRPAATVKTRVLLAAPASEEPSLQCTLDSSFPLLSFYYIIILYATGPQFLCGFEMSNDRKLSLPVYFYFFFLPFSLCSHHWKWDATSPGAVL